MTASPTPSWPAASARGERAEKAIANAVLDLLDEHGAAGLTMDTIAARAKVGKPTIYRRWSTKADLVAYAFDSLAAPAPSTPETGLREVLVGALGEFRDRLTDTRHGRVWRKVLGTQGEYADALAIYRDKYLNPRRAVLADTLQHHIDAGTVRTDVDADTLIRIMSNTMLGGIVNPDEEPAITDPKLIVDLFLDGLRTND